MDVKFQGTIQLIDRQNIYTYQVPGCGSFYGKTNLNTKDIVRRILLQPGMPKSIDLGIANAGVFLAIITDNDITITLQNSSYINNLLIKTNRIDSNGMNFGFFISTIYAAASNTLEIYGENGEANVDVYFALLRENESGTDTVTA